MLFKKRFPKRASVVIFLASNLLGVCLSVCAVRAETVLHSFVPGSGDGYHPEAGLVMDATGNLYGTTYFGGNNTHCKPDCGTVFKLSPDGTETVLHSFGGGKDGANPIGVPVFDKLGNLYGSTFAGGGCSALTAGCGTVFKITPSGKVTILYRFNPTNVLLDGENPHGGVVLDATGNLYGTTQNGGAFGGGIVFKLTPAGKETVLYNFGAISNDGSNPLAGVILDKNGNLYGTATSGGTGNGSGTVFVVTPAGQETVLWNFGVQPGDGANPEAGLVMDTRGNLYGTTYLGGNAGCFSGGCGTVFRISPTGKETVLYRFPKSGSNGNNPQAGLVFDAGGSLYGTTFSGGAYGGGVVFKLIPSRVVFVLWSVGGPFQGYDSQASLIFDNQTGTLYGTTDFGGTKNGGTVFSIP